MSIEYNGEHQICFWRKVFNPSPYVVGDRYMTENPKFSWDDFHLIPLSRPFISASKPHYTLVTIPNSSKRVNITDFLSGGLTYESRTGEWEFAIDHDKWGNWIVSHHELEDFFNGSKMLVALNDDPTKIYEGRITLKEYDAGESYSTIKMAYDLDPEELPSTALANVMFRVRFLDKRNNVLQGILSGYGSAPYYPDAAPSEEGQAFKNWSPVPSAVTGNTDYKPIYEKVEKQYRPSRIEITTPPDYVGPYGDGAYISFEGLVVTAYCDNDEPYDTSATPNGVIPIEQLEFPVTVAKYDPEADLIYGFVESVEFEGLNVPVTTHTHYHLEPDGLDIDLPFGYKKYAITWRPGTRSFLAMAASDEPVDGRGFEWTYNGKTVYFEYLAYLLPNPIGSFTPSVLDWNDVLDEWANKPPVTVPWMSYHSIAWSMMYDPIVEYSQGGVQIPVVWHPLGSGAKFETSFGVEVLQPPSGIND